MTLQQKLLFLEMYETPQEKHGFSRVREGPGAQFGATWAQKSCPKGVRTGKRCLGQGRRRGQDYHLQVFWMTLYQKLQFLEMYAKLQEKHCFEGSIWVRAQGLTVSLPQKKSVRRVRFTELI